MLLSFYWSREAFESFLFSIDQEICNIQHLIIPFPIPPFSSQKPHLFISHSLSESYPRYNPAPPPYVSLIPTVRFLVHTIHPHSPHPFSPILTSHFPQTNLPHNSHDEPLLHPRHPHRLRPPHPPPRHHLDLAARQDLVREEVLYGILGYGHREAGECCLIELLLGGKGCGVWWEKCLEGRGRW